MRTTAVKTVPRTVDQKSSRVIQDDGKARREIAPGIPFLQRGLLLGQLSSSHSSFFC